MKRSGTLLGIIILTTILFNSCGSKDGSEENLTDSSETKEIIKTAIVIEGDKVNFREEPTLNGKLIKQLNTGDRVMMLEKGERQKIDNLNDYWYKIEYKAEVGWVYGAFTSLRLEVPKKAEKEQGTAIGEVLNIEGDDYYGISILNKQTGKTETFDIVGDFDSPDGFNIDDPEAVKGIIVKIYWEKVEQYFEPAGGEVEFTKVWKIEYY